MWVVACRDISFLCDAVGSQKKTTPLPPLTTTGRREVSLRGHPGPDMSANSTEAAANCPHTGSVDHRPLFQKINKEMMS